MMMKDVMLVTGAEQISLAIARRMGYGKKIILGDKVQTEESHVPVYNKPEATSDDGCRFGSVCFVLDIKGVFHLYCICNRYRYGKELTYGYKICRGSACDGIHQRSDSTEDFGDHFRYAEYQCKLCPKNLVGARESWHDQQCYEIQRLSFAENAQGDSAQRHL